MPTVLRETIKILASADTRGVLSLCETDGIGRPCMSPVVMAMNRRQGLLSPELPGVENHKSLTRNDNPEF
jgi:hypothetical protein